MKETQIGVVSHYYDKIGVAAVELTGPLKVGDKINIKGKTDFSQEVNSMQIEHKMVTGAKKGDGVGIKVDKPVDKNDLVFKVE